MFPLCLVKHVETWSCYLLNSLELKDEDDSEEEESDEEMEVEKKKPAVASNGKPVVKPKAAQPVVKPVSNFCEQGALTIF